MGEENGEKKTLWNCFTNWVAQSWIGRVWRWAFGGNDERVGATPESKALQKHNEKTAVLNEKEVSEFVNSALELVKSNNELVNELISQLESISQDRFKDILFNYCGSISNIRFKYFSRDKESRILVLNKEEVDYLVKEKEFLQLLSQVKPEISIPKSAPAIKKANAAVKPEGSGKGPENGSNPGNPQPVKPKMPKEGGQAKNRNPGQFYSNQEKFVESTRVIAGELKLVVPESYVTFIRKNSNLLYMQCGNNVLRIAYNGRYHMSGGDGESFSINSVAMKDGTIVSSKLEEMRDKLGLNKTTEVNVTIMFPKQTTEVKSPANGSQPSPSVTSSKQIGGFICTWRLRWSY